MKPIIMFFGVLHRKILIIQRFNWQLILVFAYLIAEFYEHVRNYLLNVGL